MFICLIGRSKKVYCHHSIEISWKTSNSMSLWRDEPMDNIDYSSYLSSSFKPEQQ